MPAEAHWSRRFVISHDRCSECSDPCRDEKGRPETRSLPSALAIIHRPIERLYGPGVPLATHDRLASAPACLFACLERTLNQLVFIHQRVAANPESVSDWLAAAVQAKERPGRVFAETLSDKQHVIEVALAYWANAADAHDAGNPARAWPALAMANIYLGAAVGDDISMLKGQGALARRIAHSDPVRTKGLELLRVMRNEGEQRFASKTAVIVELGQRFAADATFKNSLESRPEKLISKWTEPAHVADHPDNVALREHLRALVTGKIRRGRTPGSGQSTRSR